MDLLHEASQYAYQAFYFDNSEDGDGKQSLFAHFKLDKENTKIWDVIDKDIVLTGLKNIIPVKYSNIVVLKSIFNLSYKLHYVK